MKKIKEITKRDFNPTSHIPPHTSENGITLIALVITMILHYDYLIKVRNSNGFLGAVV